MPELIRHIRLEAVGFFSNLHDMSTGYENLYFVTKLHKFDNNILYKKDPTMMRGSYEKSAVQQSYFSASCHENVTYRTCK